MSTNEPTTETVRDDLACSITGTSSPMVKVAAEVLRERVRQEAKWGQQNHPNGTGPYVLGEVLVDGRHRYATGLARWAKARTDDLAATGQCTYEAILTEEWAEALAESDPARLRAELIQVAAVATAWVEKIDRDCTPASPLLERHSNDERSSSPDGTKSVTKRQGDDRG